MTLNDVGKQSEEIRNRYYDFRRALPRTPQGATSWV